MELNLEQLKQILTYQTGRMYFGNWNAATLDTIYYETSRNLKAQRMFVGDLTTDIICNALWYEMSYNPVRFGTENPFLFCGQNDILYFLNTYKKNMMAKTNDLIPDNVLDSMWQISYFIKYLKSANLYDHFVKTGIVDFPQYIEILGADKEYHILSSLRRAIHAIAKQNVKDLSDPIYKSAITEIAGKRHPNGNRSEISYMKAKFEFEVKAEIKLKPQNTTVAKPVEQPAEQQTKQEETVIQMCLPFCSGEDNDLKTIREKIVQKKNEISVLEQQIEDMKQLGYADLEKMYSEMRRLQSQYASFCSQEKRLLNKK